MKKVLFVCKNNMDRSLISELIAKKIIKKKKLNKKINVTSAGISKTFAGSYQNKKSVATKVAKRFDIDLTNHRGRTMTKSIIQKSDLILVFERDHKNKITELMPKSKNKIFLMKEFLRYGSTEDIQDLGNSVGKHVNFIKMLNGEMPKILNKILRTTRLS